MPLMWAVVLAATLVTQPWSQPQTEAANAAQPTQETTLEAPVEK